MMVATAYGKMHKDPRSINTSTGKPMSSASIAVDTSSKRDPEANYWLNLLAFGEQAEILLKHQAGDSIGVVGRMQRNKWKDREGIEHEGLQLVVDTLTSSRTIRPGGRKVKKQQVQEQGDMLPPPDEEMRF